VLATVVVKYTCGNAASFGPELPVGAGAVDCTLTLALPDLPATVAVMLVDPALSALTVPLAETLATVGAVLLHVTDKFRTLPDASLATADACVV